ncbi:g11439 [Coccomyxa elongata]
MKVSQALIVLYLAAVAVNIAAGQGSGNGNDNAQYNVGSGNGNGNGNANAGNYNGNGNGAYNIGNQNGNTNGNYNLGNLNGNGNGRANTGSGNGNVNGNGNAGSNNGNNNGIGNVGDNNGNGNGNANGVGDPIFTGFAGRSFEFLGQPEHYYNVMSERNHQISTKLKVGVMWDHNGTYMEGIGFHYRSHKVVIELSATNPDTITVTLDGKVLNIADNQNELDHIVESADVNAELTINWQKHRTDLGETVELQTELMRVMVWVTPAGTVDEGGVMQPSYLNFDTTLLAAPLNNEMSGIVGETYERLLAGADKVSDPAHPLYIADDFQFHGKYEEEQYMMAGYFDDGSHALSLLGKKMISASRRLLTATKVAFPLRAGGGRENSARRHLAEGMLANSAASSAAVKFPIHASGYGVVKTSVVADKVKAARSSSRRGL